MRQKMWIVTPAIVQRVKMLVEQQKDMPFVRQRVRRNLAEDKPKVEKSEFWKQLVVCILTSRQRSGPDSPVAKLSRTDHVVLSYKSCTGQADVVWATLSRRCVAGWSVPQSNRDFVRGSHV